NNTSVSLKMIKQDGRTILKAYRKKCCLRAKEIRMSQKNMYTAGPKIFARIRDEMKQMKNYKYSENESALMDPFRIVMNKGNGGYC
ncbi:hypothetical protein R6Q57_011131, partial [Mikania cordata]